MATINLTGLLKDFQVHQGNDIIAYMELYNSDGSRLDMTGWTLVSEMRYATNGRVAITCTLANGYLSWTEQSEGKFRLHIPASATTGLLYSKDDLENLDLLYDIEVDSNEDVPGRFKPFYGTISLMREQTRIA